MISMNETQAQRDAERIREHAPKLLKALKKMVDEFGEYRPGQVHDERMALMEACEAIEYATGAHEPDSYELAGYEVDAAGTATGVSA